MHHRWLKHQPDEIRLSKKLMLDSSAPGNEGDDDQRNFKDSKRAGDDSHAYINFYSNRKGKVRITITDPH